MKENKRSLSKRGVNNPNFGKKFSAEHRGKMSASARKGGVWADNPQEYERKRYANMTEDQRKARSWSKNARNRMKRGNGGQHTYAEWETLKAQYDWTCPCCRLSEPEIKLTEDHIVPVSKGGSDNIENIQPLCKPCNVSKMTKVIKY